MGKDRDERDDDDLRPRMWASGGSWDPVPEPTDAERADAEADRPPGVKRFGNFGSSKELGDHGVIAGKFLPFHRGHQYLIEFARRSCKQLTVLVTVRKNDPVSRGQRLNWIKNQFPDSSIAVHEIDVPVEPATQHLVKHVRENIAPFATAVTHYFGSELESGREIAAALGVTFVPVDPARTAITISGTALRANVMENFRYLVTSTRPWFVRRVAVVGAESTGKSTLCARLRQQFNALVVPEWMRILVEGGVEGVLRADDIQLAARSQMASEDALAMQSVGTNAGILLCDTDLRTILHWSRRLFTNEPPSWIAAEVAIRPYDLYLLCAPDIPFVGAPARDLPAQRRAFHDDLKRALAGEPVVEISGSREERYQMAADAIIGLFTPKTLLSRRGQLME